MIVLLSHRPSFSLSVWSFTFSIAAFLFLGNGAVECAGADDSAPGPSPAIGLNGLYRAGQWTTVRVDDWLVAATDAAGPSATGPSATGPNAAGPNATGPNTGVWNPAEPFDLQTVDGDGGRVTYRQPAGGVSGDGIVGLVVPGSEAAPLTLRQNGQTILRGRFPTAGVPEKEPSMIPEGMPWVMVFGDPLGVQAIGANDLLKRDASIAVTVVDQPAIVPDVSLALRGVDLVLITPSGQSVLRDLSASQNKAMSDWLLGGGRVIVCAGRDAGLLGAADWLAASLPESVVSSKVTQLDPAGLETFTSSRTRLPTLNSLALPKTDGRSGLGESLIDGRTTRRVSAPLAVRYTTGLGHVIVLAADLESPELADWPERLTLVRRLGGDILDGERDEIGGSVRLSGYSDLAGQTRRMLDQFTLKRSFAFSVVAVIIVALIVLVAPLDYLVIQRWLGRPLLGWVTFPLVAIVLSGLLVVAAQPRVDGPRIDGDASADAGGASADSLLRLNSLEFVDIDVASRWGRLFRWNYLYSHPSQVVDVDCTPSPRLASMIDSLDQQLVYPFGYPGQAMGGIQIESDLGGGMIELKRTPSTPDQPGGEIDGVLSSLPLLPRSSQSLAVSMRFRVPAWDTSLQMRPGSELLRGRLTNPLDVDLLDAMLIYRNWVYLLPTRFPAGEVIDDIDLLRQKNFRWQLSRQRALESSSESEAWDVTRRDQPRRMAEMLMFHDAAGGSRYTSLRHEVLGSLDLSDVLVKDRCVLVGRVAESLTRLTVRPSMTGSAVKVGEQNVAPEIADSEIAGPEMTDSDAPPPGQRLSMIRVILPVTP